MDPMKVLAPQVLTGAMIILGLSIIVTLFRTFIGPRMSDRVIGVNMIGTQSICLIACLVLRLREDWLVDIAIIYAMFSFLAVAVLTKMDIGAYRQWREDQRRSRERSRESRRALRQARSGKGNRSKRGDNT